jgi:AcrR family transcriptional regulator
MSENVRQPFPQSAPTEPKQRRQPDARVRRTRQRLGMAMIGLMQDKPFDEVTVQDVLDRARVGRSTFYLHFRDKNDLLLAQLEVFLEFMSTKLSVQKESSDRVAPVAEMFEHLGDQIKVYRALTATGRLHDFYDLAQDYFARGIERRLKDSKRTGKMPLHELRTRSVALAGCLLSLMRWFMDHGAKEDPRKLDETFHRMLWEGMR